MADKELTQRQVRNRLTERERILTAGYKPELCPDCHKLTVWPEGAQLDGCAIINKAFRDPDTPGRICFCCSSERLQRFRRQINRIKKRWHQHGLKIPRSKGTN